MVLVQLAQYSVGSITDAQKTPKNLPMISMVLVGKVCATPLVGTKVFAVLSRRHTRIAIGTIMGTSFGALYHFSVEGDVLMASTPLLPIRTYASAVLVSSAATPPTLQ